MRRKRARSLLIAIPLPAALAAALACAPLPADLPAALAPGPDPSLDIINASALTICSLYVIPAEQDAWQGDRLPEGASIRPGERYTLDGLARGVYDLRAETCDGRAAERYDQPIDGPTEWTITD